MIHLHQYICLHVASVNEYQCDEKKQREAIRKMGVGPTQMQTVSSITYDNLIQIVSSITYD